MRIVCPHCTTSYAIDLATLGAAGRTVRCSRCKEVWLARPEDGLENVVAAPAMASAGEPAGGGEASGEWEAMAREEETREPDAPVVDSPSIAGDWLAGEAEWPSAARNDMHEAEFALPQRRSWLRKLSRPPVLFRASGKPLVSLPTACAAMAALIAALVIWRADVVRLLPQTAAFYRMVGLEVNLRGLLFKDLKISTETVEGKPVLVIEGVIESETRKPVELPRLRFSVRDAQDAEIYAWNAVLEQIVLKPGERAWFKSRLASPPPEGRNIDVRFFNRRDLASGNA